MSKTGIQKATPEQRKKWLEKARRTRKKKAEEKKKLLLELQSRDLQDLLDSVDKLNFFVRGLKVNRLTSKEKKITLAILTLLEKI